MRGRAGGRLGRWECRQFGPRDGRVLGFWSSSHGQCSRMLYTKSVAILSGKRIDAMGHPAGASSTPAVQMQCASAGAQGCGKDATTPSEPSNRAPCSRRNRPSRENPRTTARCKPGAAASSAPSRTVATARVRGRVAAPRCSASLPRILSTSPVPRAPPGAERGRFRMRLACLAAERRPNIKHSRLSQAELAAIVASVAVERPRVAPRAQAPT